MLKTCILSLLFASPFTALCAQPSLGDLVDETGVGWMLGTWEGKTPNGGQNVVTMEWDLNRNVIMGRFNYDSAEGRSMTMLSHDTGEVRYLAVTDEGLSFVGKWEIVDGKPVRRVEGTFFADGEKRNFKAAFRYERIDSDTVKVSTFWNENADAMTGPSMDWEMKRRK